MLTVEQKLGRLVEALKLVASEAAVQIDSFPDFVACADEVALTFDECLRFVTEIQSAGLMNDARVSDLRRIDRRMEEMSDSPDKSVWYKEALFDNEDWAWLRSEAKRLLETLGIPCTRPILDWQTFIPGSKRRIETGT